MDKAKKAELFDQKQNMMQRDFEQATSTYNTDIAKLKRENEAIQKRFEENNKKIGCEVAQIQSMRD